MKNRTCLAGLVMVLCVVMWVPAAFANNMQVSNVGFYDLDEASSNVWVKCDVSWDNSWRVSGTLTNWDAAWVFVKYADASTNWQHAYFSTNDSVHTAAEGSAMDVGVSTNSSGDYVGAGVFLYRASNGTGNNDFTDVRLCWDYSGTGLDLKLGTNVNISVNAIEMVYVSEGRFWVGTGGVESGRLRVPGSDATPVLISTAGSVIQAQDTNYDDPQIEGNGIYVDGDEGIGTNEEAVVVNTDFPTGYKAFYCMKYEISQGQYRDFLNKLTRAQQNTRTESQTANNFAMSGDAALQNRESIRNPSSIPVGRITFGCDCNTNGVFDEVDDGGNRACWLSRDDGMAYSDWAGLRPMTELEFEKACRGPESPQANEYAWGSVSIYGSAYGLTNGGQPDAVITNSGSGTGNASYDMTDGDLNGPLRCGIFAASTSGPTRAEAGATYYGMMEMSGNLYERPVAFGNVGGRTFRGTHGDGKLAADGSVDGNSDWKGCGLRGGNWLTSASRMGVSYRKQASYQGSARYYEWGWRCVRQAPVPESCAPGAANENDRFLGGSYDGYHQYSTNTVVAVPPLPAGTVISIR